MGSFARASREPVALAADETALIARVQAGDIPTFESLFRAHVAILCAFAFRYLSSRALAEEVVQDVFFSIWSHHASWQPQGTISAYLHRAVQNRAFTLLTRERTEARWRAGSVVRGMPDAPPADADLLSAEASDALSQAVSALPLRPRQVFLLAREHHLTYAEIAESLQISVKTVEIHMGRAIKALRQRLGPFLR